MSKKIKDDMLYRELMTGDHTGGGGSVNVDIATNTTAGIVKASDAYSSDYTEPVAVTPDGSMFVKKQAGGGGASIVVDDTVTPESANPVKSSGIVNYVTGITDVLDTDLAEAQADILNAQKDIENKLDTNQGALKEGQVLTVGPDGNVTPKELPTAPAPDIPTANTQRAGLVKTSAGYTAEFTEPVAIDSSGKLHVKKQAGGGGGSGSSGIKVVEIPSGSYGVSGAFYVAAGDETHSPEGTSVRFPSTAFVYKSYVLVPEKATTWKVATMLFVNLTVSTPQGGNYSFEGLLPMLYNFKDDVIETKDVGITLKSQSTYDQSILIRGWFKLTTLKPQPQAVALNSLATENEPMMVLGSPEDVEKSTKNNLEVM